MNNSRDPLLLHPAAQIYPAPGITLWLKEVALAKWWNDEMQLYNLSFPKDEVGIPNQEHPSAMQHCTLAKQQEEKSLNRLSK